MSAITLLVPRTDYMQKDDYDLLDSILLSAGFEDEGVFVFDERAFRRYHLRSELEEEIPFRSTISLTYGNEDELIHLYSELQLPDEAQYKLASYGIFMDYQIKFGDQLFWRFYISRNHLPFLAQMCKNGVKASKRVIEEQAFFKFMNRGYGHGGDLADWLAAEWEADQRIQDILHSL